MIVWITHAKVGHRQAPLTKAKAPAIRAGAFLLRAMRRRAIWLFAGKRLGNTSCPDALYQLAAVAGIQLCGSNSPMRLAGWVGSRSRTSLRYRYGLWPLSRAD